VILILGKRSQVLNGPIEDYSKYRVRLIRYFNMLTDERPRIIPKKVRFFEIIEEK
jgi:hypothetical protein